MLISIIIPTRNRHQALAATIERLEAIAPTAIHESGGIELIIADNDSAPPARVPRRLINGLRVTMLRLPSNRGAAARNEAARLATGKWLLMLDDDSAPVHTGFIEACRSAGSDVAAICADIWLPAPTHGAPRRESGGLPEVPVGCGVAYRRDLYNDLGGYDPSFLYYAEEYDLAARLINAGYRIIHDHRFVVEHRKVTSNRRFGDILHRLVLNNAAVWQRYAPDHELGAMLDRDLARLHRIAEREAQLESYAGARAQLEAHLETQPRTPLSQPHFDRLIGRDAIRRTAGRVALLAGIRAAQLWLPDDRPGKHSGEISNALAESGIEPIENNGRSPRPDIACIPATLAPGPMLDAAASLCEVHRHSAIILPWEPMHMAPLDRVTASIAA